MKKPSVDINKVWQALAKYGIHTEEELDEAIKNMPTLNIGCMVSPVKIQNKELNNKNELQNAGSVKARKTKTAYRREKAAL